MTDSVGPRAHPLPPLALLFMIGALWGFFFVLLKTGLTTGVSPMGYLFWFTLGTGSGLYIVGTLVGRCKARSPCPA